MVGRRLAALLLPCLALIMRPAAAHDSGIHMAPIAPAMCVLRASSGMTPAALFGEPARFDCDPNQKRWGQGDFWVLMRGFSARSTTIEPLQLRWGSAWQDRVTVHVLHADGGISATGITAATTSPHLQLGAQIALELPPGDSPATAILAHVEGAANLRAILIAPTIEPVAAGEGRTLALVALYAACGGLSIALIVYNLMLWSALRLRFLLYYCAMVGATMVYGISSSGTLAWMLPWIDNNDRLRINYLLLALVGVAGLTFIRHFFEDGVFPAWLRRAMIAASAAVLGSGIAFAALAPRAIGLLDLIYSLSYLAMLCILAPVVICAWRAKSRFLRLFLFAWSIPILFAALRIAHGFGLIPQHFWLDNSTLVAMSVESLLSSLAVAFRIRALSAERDHARETAEVARELADTDPLTGLLNRRAFLRGALDEDGGTVPQRLLLVDIDNFKRINDRLGHVAGDEVLKRVSALLHEAAGPATMTARLGGEEFGLLGAIEDGGASPEGLLAACRTAIMPHGAKVTLSIGIAEGVILGEADWQRLYRRADAALYSAKQAGRDRACVWTEDLGEQAA